MWSNNYFKDSLDAYITEKNALKEETWDDEV